MAAGAQVNGRISRLAEPAQRALAAPEAHASDADEEALPA
ncbi:Cell shape determination protein CcmA OS=Rhodanobacter lindaniclasticus OX=75310 GN=B1991_03160 PE=4 SV=1 [Rhodanobacter lindaniclasticus]